MSDVANVAAGDTLYLVVNAHYDEGEPFTSSTDDSTGRIDNRRRCRVIAYDVATKQTRVLYKPRHAVALAVSPDGTHIATVSQRTLSVYNTVAQTVVKFTHTHTLSTVHFHPSQPYLATGDDEGKLILWYKYQQTQTLVVSSLHWHSHRLTALAFTIDGSYALTGGEEAVCVVWQLHTAHKQFIPRLKAPILHITVSPDGKYYALSQADNTIRIIDAMISKIIRTIDGLQFAHSFRLRSVEKFLLTSIIPSMPTYSGIPFVTLNGRPHTLQMYDVFNDRQLNECDVVGRNLVSRTDDELIIHTRIEHAVYIDQCQWLVTCERRTDGELSETSALKFWHNNANNINNTNNNNNNNNNNNINSNGRSYLLHTRIDTPHSAAIVDIVAHPTLPILVTASYDHTFKVWRIESKKRIVSVQAIQSFNNNNNNNNNNKNNQEIMSDELLIWNCACIGHYRDYTIHKMAFTHDGTVLAVAYGQVITLWSVHTNDENNNNNNNNNNNQDTQIIPIQVTNEHAAIMTLPQSHLNIILRQTLLHCSPSNPILFLNFIPNTTYLVSATESTLFVSNLLTRSIEWSINAQVTALTATNGHFAVAVINNNNNNTINTAENMNEEGRGSGHRRNKIAASVTELDDFPAELILFSPTSSTPINQWTLDDLRLERRGPNRVTSAVTFLSPPHGRAHPVIVYLNRKRQLVRIDNALGPNDVVHQTDNTAQQNTDDTRTQRSLFDRLYRAPLHHLTHETASSSNETTYAASTTSLNNLFAVPTHALPSISSLLPSIFATILTAKSITKNNSSHHHDTDRNEEEKLNAMDAEMDGVVGDEKTSLTSRLASLDAQLISSYNNVTPFNFDDDAVLRFPADAESKSAEYEQTDVQPSMNGTKMNGIHSSKSSHKVSNKSNTTATSLSLNGHTQLNGNDDESDDEPLQSNKKKNSRESSKRKRNLIHVAE